MNHALHRVVLNREASLDLRGKDLGRSGIIALSHALRSNTTLTALDLHGTSISNNEVDLLSHALLEHGRCTSIDLGANNLSAGAARALAPLARMQPLHEPALTDDGTVADMPPDDYGPPVRELRLASNSLDSAACSALLSVGRHDAVLGLESLSLAFNPLGEGGGLVLSLAMPSLLFLRNLQLHGCGLGPHGASALATALDTSHALVHLDLSDNAIQDAGVLALAGGIPHCRRLQDLLLASNGFGAAGVGALASALVRKRKCSLRLLSLHGNRLRDASIGLLVEALVLAYLLPVSDAPLAITFLASTRPQNFAAVPPTMLLEVLHLPHLVCAPFQSQLHV